MGRSQTKQLVFQSVCNIFELVDVFVALLTGGPPPMDGPEHQMFFVVFKDFASYAPLHANRT